MKPTRQLTLEGTPIEAPARPFVPFTEFVRATHDKAVQRGMKNLFAVREERRRKPLTSIYQYPGPDE